jgi:hypothetical protein
MVGCGQRRISIVDASAPKRDHPDLDEELERFAARLPTFMARPVRWLRRPESVYVRMPAAIALILGGLVGFLPVLGFWMVPLGLVLMAQDVPVLRSPMARMLAWIDRKWPARKPKADTTKAP